MLNQREAFLKLIEPHFDAGYNLARWLTRNDDDASDVFQEAAMKAFRFIRSLRGDPRPWFLQIVRNSAYTYLKAKSTLVESVFEDVFEDPAASAEALLVERASAEVLHHALGSLAISYREILVLRELENLSYEEISVVLEIPIGTVMSRLSRARELLKKRLILEGGLS